MKFAVLFCLGLMACSQERNMGTARASRERSDTAAAKPVADSARRSEPIVVFFGTSLTAGLGLDPEQAYPALVARLADSAGTAIRAINAGLSGETSAGALRRVDWVLRSPADIVVIETGANDALRGLDPDSARSNMEQLVRRVKRQVPRARIVLAQMEAPPNLGLTYTRRFHAIYSEVARREGLALMPFLLQDVAGQSGLNQADGVHPNVTGERIVAANVWNTLGPIVKELWGSR
jgi:acyl-CoA thioesterase I